MDSNLGFLGVMWADFRCFLLPWFHCWRLKSILSLFKDLFQLQACLQIVQISFSTCATEVYFVPESWYIGFIGTFAGSLLVPIFTIDSTAWLSSFFPLECLRMIDLFGAPLVFCFSCYVIPASIGEFRRAIIFCSKIRLSLHTKATDISEAPFDYSRLSPTANYPIGVELTSLGDDSLANWCVAHQPQEEIIWFHESYIPHQSTCSPLLDPYLYF